MGMAASQARYLALVARKSNCEYEGQQINQARLVLSNQSASLFSEMMGFEVPVPPSTSDYTKIEYTFKNGATTYTIDEWQQLSTPEEDYNYVVTYHYTKDTYTGQELKMTDPQVQFSSGTAASESVITAAIRALTDAKKAWDTAEFKLAKDKTEAATLKNYQDSAASLYNVTKSKEQADKNFEVTVGTEAPIVFTAYENLSDAQKADVAASIDKLINLGVFGNSEEVDKEEIYKTAYLNGTTNIAFHDELKVAGAEYKLPVYTVSSINDKSDEYGTLIAADTLDASTAKATYVQKEDDYNSLSVPTYVGNCKLEILADLDDDQSVQLAQIIKDMEAEEITTNIANCFDSAGNYLGGVYKFTYNNVVYYTSFKDLETSYLSSQGNNNIDNQTKLPYYTTETIPKEIEETKKALLETDGKGRFKSVRFEDDSVVYTLASQTTTDDAAYQDAMNEYNYKNALYEKAVQDINAKTSLIHQEDQELELRLKQLDTEQNALSTEIDAVTKVIKDNVEKSFKTFGG